MTRIAGVFAGVSISRGVAAQRHAALLTGAEMNPRVADLHAFGALADFRLLDGHDRVEMGAGRHCYAFIRDQISRARPGLQQLPSRLRRPLQRSV